MALAAKTWGYLKGGLLFAVLCLLIMPIGLSCRSTSQGGSNVTEDLGIPPIDLSAPAATEMATFAMGWFWGPDSRFGSIDGVVRTRVGYAGGGTTSPTYYNLADHSETIQIDYDPSVISYEELLEVFFTSHSCTAQSYSRQYASIIFYHDEQQRDLALVAKQQREDELGRTVVTEIVPFDAFYLAEDYHQKYYLQNVSRIWADFNMMYPDITGIINSTAAARINGYIGGYGTLSGLEEQIDSFGLSPEAEGVLLDRGEMVLIP